MSDASLITAVIVTRGDVDLDEIIDSIPFERIVVYDNSQEPDLAVYGRYHAIERTDTPVVYVQDDDCLLEPAAFHGLLAAYQPGRIVANMPERFRKHYPDSCLVGFGALFDRDLPRRAFETFRPSSIALLLEWPLVTDGLCTPIDKDPSAAVARLNPWFARTCDVVFTTLTPRVLVDVPYRNMPWCDDASRMWKQADHYGERQQMLELARKVRDE